MSRTLARLGGLGVCCTTVALCGCTWQQIRNNVAEYHVERGEAAQARNDLDAALREFVAAVRLNPDSATAHAHIGKIQRRRGDFVAAANYFAEAVRLDPFDFSSALNLGQMYQVIAARAVDKARQIEAAIRAYLHACDLRPESFDARASLADCYQQLGHLDLAAENYNKALILEPRNACALTALGVVYSEQGKFYEAIRAFKSSLEVDTNQPVVHVNLGNIYLKQDRLTAAVNSFERAQQMDSKMAVAFERLAYCRYLENKYEESLKGYSRAIQLDDKLADAFLGRGVVQMWMFLQNRENSTLRERAIEDWHRSLELRPDQPKIRALLVKYAPEPRRSDERALTAGS